VALRDLGADANAEVAGAVRLDVIALHSPVKVTETGLRMCRPEKSRQIYAIRSRAIRSLQSALRTKYYEIRASLRISPQKAGPFLCGLDLLAERVGFEPSVPFL
jgi:hypothetical protein